MSPHEQHLSFARVCLSQGEQSRVLIEPESGDNAKPAAPTEPTGETTSAFVSGSLRFELEENGSGYPVTGDWVRGRQVSGGLFRIEELLPRRTKISRMAAGRRATEQVLAANVDLAFIVSGLDGDHNLRRLERYLAIAIEGGVAPVIVLNKADLATDLQAIADETRSVLGNIPVLAVSAATGQGFAAIQDVLKQDFLKPEATAVLLGSSGAGKSTITNRLLGFDRQETGSVRESDSRGRHTTTGRELFRLPSGAWLIDTPGLREIQLAASRDSVDLVFDEIATLAADCQFADCSHTVEPGCAVRDAIDPERLASYHKLNREAVRTRSATDTKARWKEIHKEMKRFRKHRGR